MAEHVGIDNGLMARVDRLEKALNSLQVGFATLLRDVERLGDKTRAIERDIINLQRQMVAVEIKGPQQPAA